MSGFLNILAHSNTSTIILLFLAQEICAVSKVSKKDIGKCFKQIVRTLETSMELIKSGDFMSRFCSNLGLSQTIQRVRSSGRLGANWLVVFVVCFRSFFSVFVLCVIATCLEKPQGKYVR